MQKENKEIYLSMAEASKACSYQQGYLSLLARRGELKAKKIGRNWYTTAEWLGEYVMTKKPNEEFFPGNPIILTRRTTRVVMALVLFLFLAGMLFYSFSFEDRAEKKRAAEQAQILEKIEKEKQVLERDRL